MFVVRERMARMPEREKTCSRGCSVTMSVNRANARFVGANVASLQTSSAISLPGRHATPSSSVRSLLALRARPLPLCPNVPKPAASTAHALFPAAPTALLSLFTRSFARPIQPTPARRVLLHTLLPFAAAIAGEGSLVWRRILGRRRGGGEEGRHGGGGGPLIHASKRRRRRGKRRSR